MKQMISGNDKAGFYLPADDRRHYVAWSERRPEEFCPDYFTSLYDWYANGGIEHVNAYLQSLDLSGFNPKAPPPKTPAFWEIVGNGQSTEASELDDLLDWLNQPFSDERPEVITIKQLVAAAQHHDARGRFEDVLEALQDKRARKAIAHKLARAGYTPLRNETDAEGRWRVAGSRVTIYGRNDTSIRARLDAADKLVAEMFVSDAEEQRAFRTARKSRPTSR
jgi:hypothetical protein